MSAVQSSPHAIPTSQLQETEWLRAMAQRDGEALLALYQRYGTLVYSLALRILRQPASAEEVTQDVFLKLWQRPDRWNPAFGQFSSWLLTLTRNAAIDHLRREDRHNWELLTSDDVELRDSPTASISISVIDDPMWYNGQILRRLLQSLPAEQRTLVELAFFSGFTHSELAERLQLPLGTVKTRLRMGLQKLRLLWVEENAKEDVKS